MITFTKRNWQIASITLIVPQNCTPKQAADLFAARFCYIFVLFPRAADLFLNSETDGGPVRDAVIMCEKPSNNRIGGDRKSIPDSTGKSDKSPQVCRERYLCIAVSTVNRATTSLCPAEKSKRFFSLPRKSVIVGKLPQNTKKRGSFPRPDHQITQ